MARTEEQIAADNALTAAIEAVVRAYDTEGNMQRFIPIEYLVITARLGVDEDGYEETSTGLIFRDGDVPLPRCLGLVDYAQTQLRHQVTI